jgi:hypothetical protein
MSGSVDVQIRRSALGVAPEAILFDVTAVRGFGLDAARGPYMPAFHALRFTWHFGDAGARHDRPASLLPHQRVAETGYGPAVGHVYRRPGTYRVRLEVLHPAQGTTATWETELRIADPDDVFAGTATIAVEDGGAFPAVPPGALRARSLVHALDLVKTTHRPQRILLRRGSVHLLETEYSFRTENDRKAAWPNLYVAAAGEGPDPRVTWAGTQDGGTFFGEMRVMDRRGPADRLDFVWSGIRFEGPWDSTTESGLNGALFGFNFSDNADSRPPGIGNPEYVHFNNCTFDGIGLPCYLNDSSEVTALTDTVITNWMDYGILGSGEKMLLLGCEIAQTPQALGGGRKDFRHNMHGPVRLSTTELTVIDGCDFYSRTGWFTNIDGATTIQPCLRWNMSGRPGARLNLQRSVMEGGFNVLAIARRNGEVPGVQVNALVEGTVILGSHMSRQLVTILYSGVTLRNNLLLHPGVPRMGGIFDPDAFVDLTGDAQTDRRAPVTVMFNTMVNLMQPDQYVRPPREPLRAVKERIPFAALDVRDNLLHQPFVGHDRAVAAPMGIRPREPGFRARRIVVRGVLERDVAPGVGLAMSYPHGSQEDYEGATGWHDVDVEGVRGISGKARFRFSTERIDVTNGSDRTWPAGKTLTIKLELRGVRAFPADPAFATPAETLSYFYPAEALRGAARDAQDDIERDFFYAARPVYPSAGAFEAPE